MGGAAERYAVGDDVGAVGFDGLDVGGLDFGSAAAVDEFEAGDRASATIGFEDLLAEDAVADRAGGVELDPLALDLELEGRLLVADEAGDGRFGGADTGEDWLLVRDAAFEDRGFG